METINQIHQISLNEAVSPEQFAAEVRAHLARERQDGMLSRRIQAGDQSTAPDFKRHKKPRVTGHECVLSALQAQKKLVELELNDGTVIQGFVYAYDKYTISLNLDGADAGKRRVFFKHAIMSFGSVENHNV